MAERFAVSVLVLSTSRWSTSSVDCCEPIASTASLTAFNAGLRLLRHGYEF